MTGNTILRRGLLPGALAGLVGGIVFGIAMGALGILPGVASLVGSGSAVVGFALHMLFAAIIGAGFGGLVWQQHARIGETVFWGLSYGTLWWFLGPLTLMPLLLGQELAWDVRAAQAAFPSLLGHLLYGATLGLAYVAQVRRDQGHTAHRTRGVALRGALAGLLAAWLLGSILARQGQLAIFAGMPTVESQRIAWAATLLIGLLAGLGFALLYPHPRESTGAGLIRGIVYGFVWWVAGALTLLPLLAGVGLAWTVADVRATFATLPGYLLFGAALATIYQWLHALVHLLFEDPSAGHTEEGAGARGIRALLYGAFAGLIGGLVFTFVMIQVGFLPVVASLVGAESAATGFIVHLIIADLIGASYGLLFRRQSYDVGSALGWGVSYGFFWWLLGPLTLMPILLGVAPQWTVSVASQLTASLIGHLAYGAALGVVYHWFESRYNPWWVPRSRADAERVERRKEQVLTSAPALWALTVVIALTLPVVLAG